MRGAAGEVGGLLLRADLAQTSLGGGAPGIGTRRPRTPGWVCGGPQLPVGRRSALYHPTRGRPGAAATGLGPEPWGGGRGWLASRRRRSGVGTPFAAETRAQEAGG